MKALFELFRRSDARCIFGSIRRLGGMSCPKVKCYDLRSTRALRVEGDSSSSRTLNGWSGFLSTPSGWRATGQCSKRAFLTLAFLSTPSEWRATNYNFNQFKVWRISIHALRVEGDCNISQPKPLTIDFYPRPPGGGRPGAPFDTKSVNMISIHALRVEGDGRGVRDKRDSVCISIHALRVEGDPSVSSNVPTMSRFLSTPSGWRATSKRGHGGDRSSNFYPRPPGGGRRCTDAIIFRPEQFLSTPSGWRATLK